MIAVPLAKLPTFQVIILLFLITTSTLPVTLLTFEIWVKPSGNSSIISTSVAFTIEVLFTIIVKVTIVLFPTTVKSTVLFTVMLTGTTSTVAFALTIVLFSLQLTVALLVQLPVATDLAIT